MRLRVVIALSLLLAAVSTPLTLPATPASACGGGEESGSAGGAHNYFRGNVVKSVENCTGSETSPGTWRYDGPLCTDGCWVQAKCDDGSIVEVWNHYDDAGLIDGKAYVCPGPASPPTPGEIVRAFKKIPIAPSAAVVQPPNGKTLVNFPTIFSTTAEAFDAAPLELRGFTMTFHIEPTIYLWIHGDGTSQTTPVPGVPWSETVDESKLIAHEYESLAEGLPVRVDTTWKATVTLVHPGGREESIPVGETVTIRGTEQALEVISAEPRLVQ